MTEKDDAGGQKTQNDDLWSVGVVILELCLLKSKLINPLLNAEERKEMVENCLEEVKAKYEVGLVRVLTRLLASDPSQRGSAAEHLKIINQLIAVNNRKDEPNQYRTTRLNSWKKEKSYRKSLYFDKYKNHE